MVSMALESVVDFVDKVISDLIPYIATILSAGIVLYFDGIIFSGGKGWVKGLKNTFETLNKGFMYFLANIIVMLVVGFLLKGVIEKLLFTHKTYFLPLLLQAFVLMYVYYLHEHSKGGALKRSVIILELIVILFFYICYIFF